MCLKPRATPLKKLIIISLCIALALIFSGAVLYFGISSPASMQISEVIYYSGFFLWVISLIFTTIAKCRREPVKAVFVLQLIGGLIIYTAITLTWAFFDA